jgi:glycosyltransferase involved in cell wall biosynthesis
MKIIIYIPAYNEEEEISNVIANIPKDISGVDEITLLVVDDGSTDKTADLARESGADVVSHRINRGLGIAFQSGMQYALDHSADILVGIDADNQFDPNDIPRLIQPIIEDEAELVTGNRFAQGKPENMPAVKYWGNKQVARIVSMATGNQYKDVSCGFRAYSREALLHMNLFGTFSYTHEAILNLAFQGLPIVEVPIGVRYYDERESRIAGSIMRYAVNAGMIIFRTVLDYHPLRFFGSIGVISIVIAMGFLGYLLGYYVLNGAFTPYKSFGFISLGFGVFGLIVLFIGLVADMLNRVRINQDKLLYQLKKNREIQG